MGIYYFKCRKCKGKSTFTTIGGWHRIAECACPSTRQVQTKAPVRHLLIDFSVLSKKEARLKEAAIGGLFTYLATPTSIGTSLSIRCNACRRVKVISNEGEW